MCGIAGFAGPGEKADLERMTRGLAHRGPDAEGFWEEQDKGVFLGHRRLSIIDLGDGAQPMWTEDGALGVVFNGEIYNHMDLRAELEARGHAFQTDHSDTETLLHGYREWGEALPEKLNGMWAFVLYDRAKEKIFASRDRFGQKPLYYTEKTGGFAFSSELRSLLRHSALRPEMDPAALQKYFAYCYIPSPLSLYKGVYKLPAGHSLVYDLRSRTLSRRKYWEFELEPEQGHTEQYWCARIRETLDQGVRRRLMADVPLGIFLSGGIDSSAIAAFAARYGEPGSLQTFSIGFDEASFDESSHARRVAERVGARHRNERLNLAKSRTLLPKIAAALDEPMGDGSFLPTCLLSEFTRRHVKVALGGDAGDELFAGYDPFRAVRKAELYSKMMPKRVHEAIRMLAARMPVSHRNISLDFKIKRTLRGLSHPASYRCGVWMGALEPKEIGDLFGCPIDPEELYSEAIAAWDACGPSANLIDRTIQFYTRLYLQDDILTKVDRASMRHGLEARSPFLDIDFVNLVRRIPSSYKYRFGQTKYILKKALAPLLPDDILYRPKKGFGIPIGAWMQEHSAFFFPHEDADDFGGLFDREFIEDKIRIHKNGKADERLFLWNYWVLQQWMKQS